VKLHFRITPSIRSSANSANTGLRNTLDADRWR
jgi:hypothetical protein